MNAEKLFKLVMALFFATTIIGCFDTDDDNSSSNQTSPPEINRISLEVCYADGCWAAYPYEARVGDLVLVVAWFRDRDNDIRTLYINHFHESDGFTTALLTQTAQIAPTQNQEFQYVLIDDTFTASEPTGYWKLRFYAVDDAGNESNEYEIDFLVRDSIW